MGKEKKAVALQTTTPKEMTPKTRKKLLKALQVQAKAQAKEISEKLSTSLNKLPLRKRIAVAWRILRGRF